MSYYPPAQQGPGQVPLPGQQTHTMAIVSLIFGILGLVQVCPGLGSIIAVVTGNMAKGDIQRDPARYTGEGLAKGGVILGWIGIALMGCALCGFVIWLLFFGGMVILGLSQPSSWLPVLHSF